MGKDYKQELISSIKEHLTFLDPETAGTVVEKIAMVLADYSVDRAVTELVPYDDTNDRILKRYIACLYIDGKSEGTIKQYRRTARKLAMASGKRFTDMGAYDIRAYLAGEKARGISNATLETTRANLSAFFQWMTVEDMIGKNPCMAIKPIKVKEEIRFAFSSVEMDLMRSACKSQKERALIEFLASSGVRVSELTSMQLSDIDIQRMTVHVKHGKGGKERTTYISEVAKEHLLAYVTDRKENGTHLFYNAKGLPMAQGGVRHILKEIGKRAGVEDVHPHRFRRTFATGRAARGMQVQEIQRLLGHSSIETTMEYVCVSDDQVKASYRQYIA